MEFVVCLAFDQDYVILIKKNRPEWQAGKLNGPGGKVEAGEGPEQAAAREFAEETGVTIAPEKWRRFALLKCGNGDLVHFLTTANRSMNVKSLTDEQVSHYLIAGVYGGELPVIPNLRWLIPLALDKDAPFAAIAEPPADAGVPA